MSGGDPIANIKLLEGTAKNLEHDPEKREPAVLLDYLRVTPCERTSPIMGARSEKRHNRTHAPQQYILDDPYRNMGVAVGIFATPEKFSALPISVLEL
jgi:hypothetical protein